MVVVQDLEAQRLRPLANGVQLIGHAPVVVERAPAILRDGGNARVAPPDLVGRLADLLRPIAQRVELHVHGRRREPVPVETLTHLPRGTAKEPAPGETEVLRGLCPSAFAVSVLNGYGPKNSTSLYPRPESMANVPSKSFSSDFGSVNSPTPTGPSRSGLAASRVGLRPPHWGRSHLHSGIRRQQQQRYRRR